MTIRLIPFLLGFSCLASPTAMRGEEFTSADYAITAAIAGLETKLAEAGDKPSQEKIRRAIRELEKILEEGETAAPVDFEVKPAALKKKFKGKAVYDPKTGVLSLGYDFSRKDQLKDFQYQDASPVVADQALRIDGGEKITHAAKFKWFTVRGLWGLKAMRGGGIASTNGSHLGVGGANPDTLYLGVAGGQGVGKIVPDQSRSGVIPFQLSVSPKKTSVQYADERLTAPTARPDDIHQIVFDGGVEGYAFSGIVISGVPDPEWFQEFLEAK